MNNSVFEFMDYRKYLNESLPTKGDQRGVRTKLADFLGVQKGFISSILHGGAELSLEQSFRVSRFLSQTEEEQTYFLLLVQKARAGSKDLEEHFTKKIHEIQTKRKEISERIQIKTALSESDQLLYYSSWHYTAIHMCLRIKKTQTAPEIAKYLSLPVVRISEMLEFFLRTGIAIKRGDHYVAGATRIHIAADSPSVSKHHSNWRMQSIQSLDRKNSEDLHYSLVMSISNDAAQKIRELLLQSIQASEPAIKDAKDEEVFGLTIDLFKVGVG